MPGAEPENSFTPAVGGGNSRQFCQQAQGEAGGAAEEHYQNGAPAELSQLEEGTEEESGAQPLKELFADGGSPWKGPRQRIESLAEAIRVTTAGRREHRMPWRAIPHW